MVNYHFIVPNAKLFSQEAHFRIYRYTLCLHTLPMLYDNTTISIDDGTMFATVPQVPIDRKNHKRSFVANKNGEYASFFMVNDKLFMYVDADSPVSNSHRWIPFFEEHGIAGLFIVQKRTSTEYMLDNCSIPTFPMASVTDYRVPLSFLEHDAHAKSMCTKKDISVFFSGRCELRPARHAWRDIIRQQIPNSLTNNRHWLTLSTKDYIESMCRAKIFWCPRSVKSRPDHDCNGITSREVEGMCLETLIVRPPNGLIEVEPRLPEVHFVEVQNDNSDLIDKLRYYLEHDEERKEIAYNGRLWYERNSTSVARAKHLFSCVKECL